MKPKVVAAGTVEQTRDRKGGFGLVMRAETIRQTPTGLHATLTLLGKKPDSDPRFLAGTTCNVTRDEERTKLLNTARRQATVEYEEAMFGPTEDKVLVKRDFDLFCFSIWDTLLETKDAEMLAGDSMSPLEFIAKPHVVQGGGTILFGKQGKGKSYTAILCAVCVQHGLNGLWDTKQTETLFINLERSAKSLQRRIGHINDALGLPPDSPLLTINARGRSLLDVQPTVERAVAKHNVGFIVVDSISRMGIGDLTLNHTSNSAMDLLNSLAPSWLGLGHSPRADESHLYGSVMWEAGADIMVRLTSEKQELNMGIRLEVTKANDIKFPKPMTLVYGFDEFGLKAVRLARSGEYATLEADTRALPQKIYDCLTDDLGKASATQIAKALGIEGQRGNISRILKSDDRFGIVSHDGRETYYAVMVNQGGV